MEDLWFHWPILPRGPVFPYVHVRWHMRQTLDDMNNVSSQLFHGTCSSLSGFGYMHKSFQNGSKKLLIFIVAYVSENQNIYNIANRSNYFVLFQNPVLYSHRPDKEIEKLISMGNFYNIRVLLLKKNLSNRMTRWSRQFENIKHDVPI